MLNSFVYMFKDKGFWKKYLALFGAVLFANLLLNFSGTFAPALNGGKTSAWYYILFFAGFVAMFVPYGYSISALKTTLDNGLPVELPMLKIVENFVSGFKVVVSGLILMILVILVIIAIIFLNNVLSAMLGEFVSMIFNVILFLLLMIVSFLGISMCCRYVVKPSYLNFINFKAALSLANTKLGKYFIVFLLSILSTIIIYLIAMLSVSVLTKMGYWGLIIYCLLVSVMWTYQIFLLAGLFSKAVDVNKI